MNNGRTVNYISDDWQSSFYKNKINSESNSIDIVSAPLWQQAFDWFREKHNMYIEITYEGGLQKDTSLYSFQIWSNQTSDKSDKMDYYEAREQAILKAIELCKKINLEEILQDCYVINYENRKEVYAPIEDVKSAMIEFGKQLLELAAKKCKNIY